MNKILTILFLIFAASTVNAASSAAKETIRVRVTTHDDSYAPTYDHSQGLGAVFTFNETATIGDLLNKAASHFKINSKHPRIEVINYDGSGHQVTYFATKDRFLSKTPAALFVLYP